MVLLQKPLNRLFLSRVARQGEEALDRLEQQCRQARRLSEELLLRLLRESADTEYGRRYGFASISSVAQYQAQVPLTVYDDYAAYVERMVAGEKGLITNAPIEHYAVTSGSVNNPKLIPVSASTLADYHNYSANSAIGSMSRWFRQRGEKLPLGLGFYAVEISSKTLPNGVPSGSISATSTARLRPFFPWLFTSPPEVVFPQNGLDLKYLKCRYGLAQRDVTYMSSSFMTMLADLCSYMEHNWELLCDDISAGTIDSSIRLPEELRERLTRRLKPAPKRGAELRAQFEQGFDTPILPRIWPRLGYILSIGSGGFATYTEKMRRYAGDIPMHFLVYAASEALMGVALEPESEAYALLPGSGFYEFIPQDEEGEDRLLTIDQVEPGRDYELVLTNTSGLYRYRIQDVVRVLGFFHESPLITFRYRKNQLVSLAGEKTNEQAVRWAVSEFARESGQEILDYSVFADPEPQSGGAIGRYMLLLEPTEHLPRERHEEYRRLLEEKLSLANPSLGKKIADGLIGPTEVVFLQQETYALYRDMMMLRGVSANQLKPVRIIDTPMKERFFFGLEDKE